MCIWWYIEITYRIKINLEIAYHFYNFRNLDSKFTHVLLISILNLNLYFTSAFCFFLLDRAILKFQTALSNVSTSRSTCAQNLWQQCYWVNKAPTFMCRGPNPQHLSTWVSQNLTIFGDGAFEAVTKLKLDTEVGTPPIWLMPSKARTCGTEGRSRILLHRGKTTEEDTVGYGRCP